MSRETAGGIKTRRIISGIPGRLCEGDVNDADLKLREAGIAR